MIHFSSRPVMPAPAPAVRPASYQPTFGTLYPANRDIPDDRFYPAKPNRALLWTAKQIVHWAGVRPMDFRLILSDDDNRRLNALVKSRNHSVMVTPNHAHLLDVLSIMELSRQTQINFVAIGAIELFERRAFGKTVSWSGSILQRLGIFSVNRGARDKSVSLDSAKRVVKEGEHPFMIFPEGHVTWANQEINHLKHGAAQTAISVVRDGRNVQIVPIAFFYDNQGDLVPRIDKHLESLEAVITGRLDEAGLPIPALKENGSRSDRINRLFGLMLADKELKEGLPARLSDDPYQRVEALKAHVLGELEQRYLGQVKSGPTEIRARRVIGAVTAERRQAREGEPGKQGWFRRKAGPDDLSRREQKARWKQDIDRLSEVMLLSMYPPGYVVEEDHNRMIETLFRLDRDINGGKEPGVFSFWRHVRCHVKVGEPIDVSEFLSEGEIKKLSDEDLVEEALSGRIETALEKEIARMAREAIQRKALQP